MGIEIQLLYHRKRSADCAEFYKRLGTNFCGNYKRNHYFYTKLWSEIDLSVVIEIKAWEYGKEEHTRGRLPEGISREQLEGHSLDAQEHNIKEYINSQGWEMVRMYTDAGISAKKDSHRPELERLLEDARGGQFDVVVVDKIDRFYRHLGGAADHPRPAQRLWASDLPRCKRSWTSPRTGVS